MLKILKVKEALVFVFKNIFILEYAHLDDIPLIVLQTLFLEHFSVKKKPLGKK